MSNWKISDLADLTLDIYNDAKNRGINGWNRDQKQPDYSGSDGLQIDTYTNGGNTRIIAIGGTNSFSDVDDSLGFSGLYVPKQVEQAMEYVAEQLDAANKGGGDALNPDTPEFVVTGHSLGGGISQLIGAVFNIPGMSLDGPGAAAVYNSKAFQGLKTTLQQKYPDAFNHTQESTFENSYVSINEKGSAISSIGTHLGDNTVEIDAMSNSASTIGGVLSLSQLPPLQAAGLLLLAAGQLDNHSAKNLITYLKKQYPEEDISAFIEDLQDKQVKQELEVSGEHTSTAEIAGAGASTAFMSYARLNGWTDEWWLDDAWEQSVASFAVSEAAKDIADLNFESGDYNVFDWNAAGGSLVASLAANAIADELGLGGTNCLDGGTGDGILAGDFYNAEYLYKKAA